MQNMQSNIKKQNMQKIQYKQYMNIYNNKSTCRPPLVAEGNAHLHRFCLLAVQAVRETDIDPNGTQTRIYQSYPGVPPTLCMSRMPRHCLEVLTPI
jgi:hypothetical protein